MMQKQKNHSSAPNITPKEHGELAKKASPPSPSFKTIPLAFLFGGSICCLGEALANLYLAMGFPEPDARGLVSITLIGTSALLTALGFYDDIAKLAGAGTLVPITGFANSVVSPALEFKSEGFIAGLGGKMFVIAGPVLVYGINAAAVYGLVLWIFG